MASLGMLKPTLKEWIPAIDDCRYWGKTIGLRVKSRHRSLEDPVYKQLQSYLSFNNLYIGPNTFSSGFILVLHEACRLGDVDTVDYILKHHVHQFDINQLILHYYPKSFVPQHCTGNIKFLDRDKYRSESLIHTAVRGESIDILKMLVDYRASLETTDCCGKTPLLTAIGVLETQLHSNKQHAATQLCLNERNSKSYHTVLYLIEAGANVNCQDKYGSTALMYLERGIPLVPVLIKAGADLQLTNNSGYTAIHNAVLQQNVKLLSELLSCQTSVSSTDTSVPHPLFFKHHMLLNDSSRSFVSCYKITTLFQNQNGFSSQLIVDSLLLTSTYEYYYSIKTKQYYTFRSFHKAIAKRSQLHLPPPSSEPHDVYGGLVEIQSLEDLKHYNNLKSVEVRIKLAYQCLIIRERCLGYGDTTLIQFLFFFGKWMLTKSHDEGWLLLLRGSNMLLSRLEGGNVSILEWSIDFLSHEIPVSFTNYNVQPNVFFVLVNLITCLGLCIDLHKKEHYHTFTLKYKQCILNTLLSFHTLSKFQYSTDVDELGKLLVAKCPLYVGYESSPSNILYTALVSPQLINDIDFIRRLLDWGGDSLVNEFDGPLSRRPLHLCGNNPEVMKLLLQHGAHLDAVDINGIRAFPSNSLQCLCAYTIATTGIPYDTLDLPRRIKQLISFHDPQVIRNKIKERINSLI